jgi:hypothetical protein
VDAEDEEDADGCVPVVGGTEAEFAQAMAIGISINAERPIAIFFNMMYCLLVIYSSILALLNDISCFKYACELPFFIKFSICRNNRRLR